MTTAFLTTTIPYVNGDPHLGHALEAVQADTLTRHHQRIGHTTRLLSGTDDNAPKNVIAAEAAGRPVQDYVDAQAARFTSLAHTLSVRYDDFIRTSTDPRHRSGVADLWRACAASGDFYRGRYDGLYCLGCEAYLTTGDLDSTGRCPEHGTPPQHITEQNWFFRLSRYAGPIREAITTGTLRIHPAQRRNEVLAFIDGGLHDICASRGAHRARGWGIHVPGDPDQVVYVRWDALGNYVNSLRTGDDLHRWWTGADRRIHLVGKGVLRFHAVYWPAILLSAGLPLPTDILVHDYVTVGGAKIAKSAGNGVAPAALVDAYGVDALRWWLLRDVATVGITDFTTERLEQRYREDLAGGIGNLVNRVVTMIHRFRGGSPSGSPDAVAPVSRSSAQAPARIAAALATGDFRDATAALLDVVDAGNRYVEATRPWTLAAAERTGDIDAGVRLDQALATLHHACATLSAELEPFLPDAAARITAQLTPTGGRLPAPIPVFP